MKLKAYYYSKFFKDFTINKQSSKRDWMEVPFNIGVTKRVTSFAPAYKCLPLKIGNELGWSVHCPVDFSCVWNGDVETPKGLSIRVEEKFKTEILSHFGNGILTFQIPYLFRTEKKQALYVRGPTNYYKEYIQYLDAIIETDWMNYTFTYNIKIHKPNCEIFFKKGEPIFSFIPINLNQINSTDLIVEDLEKDKILLKYFNKYGNLRQKIYSSMCKENYKKEKNGEDPKFIWMKDYFKGGGFNAENPEIGCPYIHLKKISLNVHKDLNFIKKIIIFYSNIIKNIKMFLITSRNIFIKIYFKFKLK